MIKVSPLLKAIVPLMDHRDKDVREGGKRLIIEAYRWIGDMMKSQLTGLKPVQLTELDTEFGNLEGVGKAKPERWLKSAGPPKEVVREAREDGEEDDEEEEDSQESELDPYEMLDPVEILSKLPKNFYEQVKLWISAKCCLCSFSCDQSVLIFFCPGGREKMAAEKRIAGCFVTTHTKPKTAAGRFP